MMCETWIHQLWLECGIQADSGCGCCDSHEMMFKVALRTGTLYFLKFNWAVRGAVVLRGPKPN